MDSLTGRRSKAETLHHAGWVVREPERGLFARWSLGSVHHCPSRRRSYSFGLHGTVSRYGREVSGGASRFQPSLVPERRPNLLFSWRRRFKTGCRRCSDDPYPDIRGSLSYPNSTDAERDVRRRFLRCHARQGTIPRRTRPADRHERRTAGTTDQCCPQLERRAEAARAHALTSARENG